MSKKQSGKLPKPRAGAATGDRSHDGRKPDRSGGPRPPRDRAEANQRLTSMWAFLGYMFAMWLIVQSANNPPGEPTFGFRWSPAVLGVIVALSTALVRNERHLRSHLVFFDPERAGHLAYSVAWSVLALIAIAAVMTIPRY